MLGLLNTVLSKGNTLLTYVKDGLVMANRFLTPPKLTFPADASAEFNGTSDFIDTGAVLAPTNHTISFWSYIDGSQLGFIFDQRDADEDGIYILNLSDGQIYYKIQNVVVTSGSTYQNEWVFVSATYDGSKLRLYVNGSLIVSQSASLSISITTDARIGANSYSLGDYFNGNLANVAIWNRALSSDEINSVMWKGYNALNTTEKSGLQAWYSLEESELFDASNTSTTNLEEYAKLNGAIFEGKACLQTALNAFPDITDARLYSAKYDIRVSGDGGTVEALSCVETELNAIL